MTVLDNISKRFSKGWVAGVTLGVGMSTALVYAALEIPNSFSAGDAISASQMNENFQAVVSAIDSCEDPADPVSVMVRVGPVCVDKYEASVWSEPTGGTQYTDVAGSEPCNENGNDCSKNDTQGKSNPNAIYARSVAGELPSSNITWFQAQQACANVGKRLLTNAEWQMAAAGTPDPGAGSDDDGATTCATSDITSPYLVESGSRSACVSNWQVNDMIGNASEWVADWVQGPNDGSWTPSPNLSVGETPTYGDDLSAGINRATYQQNSNNLPGAIVRGGRSGINLYTGVFSVNATEAPSVANTRRGFRCAR